MPFLNVRARIVAYIVSLLLLALAVLLAGCGTQAPTQTTTAVSTSTDTASPDPSPATPPNSGVVPTLSPTLAAPVTPATPTAIPIAEFQISSLAVQPGQPVAGEQITLEAEVLNVGNASGSYLVQVGVNNPTDLCDQHLPLVSPFEWLCHGPVVIVDEVQHLLFQIGDRFEGPSL